MFFSTELFGQQLSADSPQALDGPLAYKIMVSSVVPRPIAWVSTVSQSGVTNLAPFSFFTVASCNPPVLCVTQIIPRHGGDKDTVNNLRATQEAVVNVVSQDQAERMNASCGNYAADISEFDAVGIPACSSQLVSPPGVRAASVRYECRLREIKTIGATPDNEPQAMGGLMLLLDVIGIDIDEQVTTETSLISADLLNAIGKMGGDEYTLTKARFSLARPKL